MPPIPSLLAALPPGSNLDLFGSPAALPFAHALKTWKGSTAPDVARLESLFQFHWRSSRRAEALMWTCAAGHMDLWVDQLTALDGEDAIERARRADRELEQALYASTDVRRNTSHLTPAIRYAWSQAYPLGPSSGYHWVEGHQNPDQITRVERLLMHASAGASLLLDTLDFLWPRIAPHLRHVAPVHVSRWLWWIVRAPVDPRHKTWIHRLCQVGADPHVALRGRYRGDTEKSEFGLLWLSLDFWNYRSENHVWPMGMDVTSQQFSVPWRDRPRPSRLSQWPRVDPATVTATFQAGLTLTPVVEKVPSGNGPARVAVTSVDERVREAQAACWSQRVCTLLRLGAPRTSLAADQGRGLDPTSALLEALGGMDVQDGFAPAWVDAVVLTWAWPQWRAAGWTWPARHALAILDQLDRLQHEPHGATWLRQVLTPAITGYGAWWPEGQGPAVLDRLMSWPTLAWSTWWEPEPGLNRQLRRVTDRWQREWGEWVDVGAHTAWVPCALESALNDWLDAQPSAALLSEWWAAWETVVAADHPGVAARIRQEWVSTVPGQPTAAMQGASDAIVARARSLWPAVEAAWQAWSQVHIKPMPKAGLGWMLYRDHDLDQMRPLLEIEDHARNRYWLDKMTKLGRRGGYRALSLADAALAAVPRLRASFPHFNAILDRLESHWTLSRLGHRGFSLPPLLLVGPPGTGKTFFFAELAAAVENDYHVLNMESVTAGFAIVGSDPTWGASAPGYVFEKLAVADKANPIFLLDEIDKCSSGTQSPVEPVLLSLLEPHSARHFKDRCFPLPLDIRQVAWVATANDLTQVTEPIQSRFEVWHVPQPDLDARRALARTIYGALRRGHAWGAFFDETPSAAFIEALASPPGSARHLRKFITQAFAAAARHHRPTLQPGDLPSGGAAAPRAAWDFVLPEPPRAVGASLS